MNDDAREFLESQLQEIRAQMMRMQAAGEEVGKALLAVQEIDENGEFIAVLGSGVVVPAKVSGKILVEVGAGVLAEKSKEEAKDILEERAKGITSALAKLQETGSEIVAKLQEVN
jgi:prefoldin alpha subunit